MILLIVIISVVLLAILFFRTTCYVNKLQKMLSDNLRYWQINIYINISCSKEWTLSERNPSMANKHTFKLMFDNMGMLRTNYLTYLGEGSYVHALSKLIKELENNI